MAESTKYQRRDFLKTIAVTGSAIASGSMYVEEVAAESTIGSIVSATSVAPDPSRMKTLLVLDRESVAAAEGVTFQLNSAKKHPENPVLLPGEPQQWDGLQVVWPGTVLYDDEDKLFRCWYSGLDAVQKNRASWVPGYAESRDGIHWTKPELGQHVHSGQPTNRIAVDWSDAALSLVVKNPDRNDPERRFLALWMDNEPDRLIKTLASSGDGKKWKHEGTAFRPDSGERSLFFDISQLIFQPSAANADDRVIGYAQVYLPRVGHKNQNLVRQIGMVHGPHPGALRPISSKPEEAIVLAPEDGIDEEIHFASVKKIGDQWIMLFESDRFSQKPLHGDLRVAVSNDGRKFRRIHPQTPLVGTGSRGMWDENILVTSSDTMQEVGDEVWIYYFGCPNIFTRWPGSYATNPDLRGSLFYPGYLGLATLPRDRFAYAAGPGSVTTTMLNVSEQGLWLNAEGKNLAVTAVDSSGAVLAQGYLTDLQSSTVYRKVKWVKEPPRQPCQLKITLTKDQRLYSLRY